MGQRGARVQAVVAELGGEKIDVIEWSEDASTFVAKALSPAQVIEVRIDEEHRIANVVVPERMLSLAIGREGQNARLAAKLTGWRIDIRSDVSVAEAAKAAADEAAHVAEAVPVEEEAATAAEPAAPAAEDAGEAPAKPKRRKTAPEPAAAPVVEDAGEASAKPKRRKTAKSAQPEDAGEVSP